MISPDITALSPDILAETLLAQGMSPEQVEETVSLYASAKYDVKKRKLKPAFVLKSDKVVKIGHLSATVRELNVGDMKRIGSQVFQIVIHLLASNKIDAENPEEALQSINWMGLLTVILEQIMELGSGDEYPDWAIVALEELASLLVCDDEPITPEHLVSIRPIDLKNILSHVLEVNKSHFLELLGQIPQPYLSLIITLKSEIGNVMSGLNTMVSEIQTSMSSDGGAENIGKSSTSFQSKKLKTSPKVKLKKPALQS